VIGNHWPLASQYCCWHRYSFLKTFFSPCRCHSVALVLVGGGAEAVNVRTNATYTQPRVRSFATVIVAFGWPTPTGVCSTALRPPITPCATRVVGGNIVREAFPVNLTAYDIILIRAPKKYALSPTTNGNVNIVNKAMVLTLLSSSSGGARSPDTFRRPPLSPRTRRIPHTNYVVHLCLTVTIRLSQILRRFVRNISSLPRVHDKFFFTNL